MNIWNKTIYSVLVLTIGYIITRSWWVFDFPRYESATRVRQVLSYTRWENTTLALIPHLPWGVYYFKLISVLFTDGILGVQSAVFLSWLAIQLIIYFYAKLILGNEKYGLIAWVIYLIRWYAYQSNIQIDQDWTINSFLFLTTLCLRSYAEIRNKKRLTLLSWAACSFLIYTRPVHALMIIWIIWIYCIIQFFSRQKDRISRKKIIVRVCLFIVSLWLLSLFHGYLLNILYPWMLQTEFSNYINKVWWNPSLTSFTTVIHFWQIILYSTLALAIPLYKFRSNPLLLNIVYILFIVYISQWRWGDPARYLMPLIPFCSILIARYCGSESQRSKHIIFWVIGSVLFIGVNHIWISYFWTLPTTIYELLQNPLQSIFPLSTTTSSPLYFYVPLLVFLLVISSILFIGGLKNRIIWKLFIAFLVAQNVFYLLTSSFGILQPNLSYISSQLSNYCLTHCASVQHIYTDQLTRDTHILRSLEKNFHETILSPFSLNLVNKDQIIKDNDAKIHVINKANLFFQYDNGQKPFDEYIKETWAGLVFLTNYLWQWESNKDLLAWLDQSCTLEFKVTDQYIADIQWVVYRCL